MNFDMNKPINYYKILGLKNGINDDKKIITDEMVEKRYLQLKEEIVQLGRRVRNEEQRKYIEDLSEAIDDAYQALKTENGRQHYDELLEIIKKSANGSQTNPQGNPQSGDEER